LVVDVNISPASRPDTETDAMLETDVEQLDRCSTKIQVRWNGTPISVESALDLCRNNDCFRLQLISALAASPFAAYFWEMPPVASSSLTRPFEFVLTEGRDLASMSPNVSAFQEHFDADDDQDGIVAFENLARDATLVVPCPRASPLVYVHLSSFLRGAPAAQTHALFRCVANEVLARVSKRPLWLSTAGMGVAWLHVRLDSRPKYYRYGPYKSPAAM
jgi:hypothetical protein